VSASSRSLRNDVFVLAKVRLNALVVFTTGIGYYMGAQGPIDVTAMALTCIGTALVAGGAAALNQIQEREVDKLMHRTRSRPMAEGRMTLGTANLWGYGLSIVGLALLWYISGPLAAGIALATLLSYVVIYTPLKRRTSLATIVGAVPGALPTLIGWAAVRGSIDIPASSLFVIMFLWQLPHFLAIAWMYREDYARASMPMLPVLDKDGSMTGRQALVYAAALLPISELPMLLGMAGQAYGIGALVLGLAFSVTAAIFAFKRTRENARLLFLASITYLPLLFALMAASKR
jgi:protoheme IX farnesyltransferase